jgi:hypothetical protein
MTTTYSRLADAPEAVGGYYTLRVLAEAMGVLPDSLRQRIHRGTLQAVKIGPLWLVPAAEAHRVASNLTHLP